jgi:hypothetical protein
MGFGRKAGVWWLIILLLATAGALLTAATTTGGVEEAGGSAGEEGRLGGSWRVCEIKCRHHHDPVNKQRCIRYQLPASGAVEDEEDGAAAAAAGAIRQVV